jgi:hypothetical protein
MLWLRCIKIWLHEIGAKSRRSNQFCHVPSAGRSRPFVDASRGDADGRRRLAYAVGSLRRELALALDRLGLTALSGRIRGSRRTQDVVHAIRTGGIARPTHRRTSRGGQGTVGMGPADATIAELARVSERGRLGCKSGRGGASHTRQAGRDASCGTGGIEGWRSPDRVACAHPGRR